ncbi:MAG: uroporphyrinogen-III synthase [Planctomycetes bacterium]|nr:uroporphyrinogen-III synthase [Planctomycetota bacterium]
MNALSGKRVWLTRSEEGNRAWEAPIRAAGAEPLSCATLRFRTLVENAETLQNAVESADWVVFTSPRGVRSWLELGLRTQPATRIAVVGQSTAEACRAAIANPTCVATNASASSLASDLLAISDWKSVALIGAQESRPELHDALRVAHKDVRVVASYETEVHAPATSAQSLQAGDAIFLASPSAFEALLAADWQLDRAHLISIGPTTSHSIRAAGLPVAAESETRTVQGMLNAWAQILQQTP